MSSIHEVHFDPKYWKQTKNLTTPCIPTYIRRCMLNTYNGCQFHMKWIPQKHRIMNWDILMFGHVAPSSQNETTRISRLENRIKSLSTIVIIQFYTFSNVIQYHNYIFVFLFIYTCFPNCLKCLRNWVLFLSFVQVLNCWVAIILLCLKNLQYRVFNTVSLFPSLFSSLSTFSFLLTWFNNFYDFASQLL